MEWLVGLEVLAAVMVLFVVVPLLGLYLRRRWLSTKGGVFDCALRLHESGPGTGWATGVCRYEGERLEWYRTFSLSVGPRLVLERDETSSLGRRGPAEAEAVVLFSEDQILRLQHRAGGRTRIWELAMHPASVTGLMSWLEAAPPGGDRYNGLETAPQ
ncbi:DUF2550 domain-containing protein [Luteococcus peritonei]|uniref:DUF2550 domain-containing protein n=1 Tax=Luteococcus peritonei TaxID=88874 RepID=A0ABW4S0M0_9ACTN